MKRRPKFRPLIRLEVRGTSLGELEDDTAASQPPVDLGVGIQSVVNTTTLLLVEDDLQGLGAVLLGAETLADNLNGVDEIGQDSIMDSGESPGAGALLLLGVARAGGALGLRQDAARSQDQDVAVRELLLQLAGEAAKSYQRIEERTDVIEKHIPLLDTVETLQGRDGDKDDNCLLAVANFDLVKTQSQHASSRMLRILGPLPVLFHEL